MNRLNSTRFMTQEEFAKQFAELDMKDAAYPVGGIPVLVKDNKIYVDAQDSHTIIFGATGSKKTRMFVMPAIGILARAGESFVVTDTKGELFDRTLGDVAAHGYKNCCINLRDFHNGITWNPLALPYRYYHNGKKAKAVEFAIEMAKMIIGTENTDDVFWPNTAIDVLSGFILLLFEKADESECHFKALVELWGSYVSNRKEMISKIKKEFANTVVYQKIASLDNASEKTVGSIEAFVVMGLNKLCLNEEFIEFISQDGLDIQKLTEEKNAIYLVVPDENTTYHFIVSLFLEQLYEVLLEKAQTEPMQKLPVRMNFLIDEFANIPRIQNMDAMITAARSRNIRFHLIVQGMKQLQQKYGDSAETISGNCNNWIYLYSKEYELLQEISHLCGEVVYDNNVRMPLFSEFDLQHLNKEEGEALVLAGRNYPCLSNLADIDRYPYPRIDIEQTVISQKWEKVSSFKYEKAKEKRYYCEPPQKGDDRNEFSGYISMMSEGESDKDTNELLELLNRRERGEDPKWLVATTPDGMILAGKIYDKCFIDNKMAIGALYMEQLSEKKFEIDCLEWYEADYRMKEQYDRHRRLMPEKVYVSIDELNRKRFTKVQECQLSKEYYTSKRKSEIELVFTDDMRREPNKTISLGKPYAYVGNMGMQHLVNIAFSKANDVLSETEYNQVGWRFVDEVKEGIRDRGYQFVKRAPSGELAVLCIMKRG